MADERRLHPLSWLFSTAQAAKGFFIPLIFVLFASGGSNYELWAALVIIPATVGGVLQYLVFRYQLGDDELVVRDGLLTRTERHIPYSRIQNIDLVQNPFHRFLDVALVRVETASGERPEAVIRVLSLDAINDMRTRVFAERSGAANAGQTATAGHPTDVILKLPAGELAKLGIVSNKGLVVMSAALGLLWQRGQWWDPEDVASRYLESEWLGELVETTPVFTGILAIGFVVVAAIVVLRVLSIGWFLVQLSDFTVKRRERDLRTEYGLFTRISRTIPTSRIQCLTTTESPLHRWFGRQSVELRTVGGSGDDLEGGLEGSTPKARSQWLAPMIQTERVPDLLRQVLPQVDLSLVEWRPLADQAWLRILRRWLFVITGATMLVGGITNSWLVLVFFTLPATLMAWGHARLAVKHAGYALTPWGLLFKSGWWDRTLKIVRYSKIQTVERGETPFDRRNRMASVRIDTAGAERIGYTIDIPFLNADVATSITTRIAAEVSRQAFEW